MKASEAPKRRGSLRKAPGPKYSWFDVFRAKRFGRGPLAEEIRRALAKKREVENEDVDGDRPRDS